MTNAESGGGPNILFVHTYHLGALDDLYRANPILAELDFEQQRLEVLGAGYGTGDACSHGVGMAGGKAMDVIVNADRMQERWAIEHGHDLHGNIHDRRRQVLCAQVNHYRPDVLYVFEWSPLGDAFLAEIKSSVRLLVGQISSPIRDDRSYGVYDLMITSWEPFVEHFRSQGIDSEPLSLAFDHRFLDRLSNAGSDYDVTFVGGFAPSHPERIGWLEQLLKEVKVDLFGYGVERTNPDSIIRHHHHGEVWGMAMYEVLQRSRITLHQHATIEVPGRGAPDVAAAMRLFEATGVGTCLITDQKGNLQSLFEPQQEVVTYRDTADCLAKIRYYLAHNKERRAIAQAGQDRTLGDHTYPTRMGQLLDIIREKRGQATFFSSPEK